MVRRLSFRPIRFLPTGRQGGGVLPWVIAVMMYLCALAIVFALVSQSALSAWSDDIAEHLTVQIVHPDADIRERQAETVIDLLSATPGITSAGRIEDRVVDSLLEQWIGSGNVTEDLPVPVLVDVTLDPNRRLNIEALRAQITRAAPEARVDDHQQWIGRVLDIARFLEIIAWSIAVLILGATIAIVFFGTRAGLSGHRASIEIMHLMGAEDAVIAGEFQYRYMLHGLKGGLIGMIAALMTLYFLDRLLAQMESGLVPRVDFSWSILAIILLMPVAAALLTVLTARTTVRRDLARMV